MATLFSDTLVKLRKESGFSTAYRFFHDNGGDKVLGMCYRKYLMMEQGRILPLFKHLRPFIFGLRVVRNSAPAKELVRAWLRTMAGDDVYEDILEPLLSDKPAVLKMSPAQKALKSAIAGRKFYMTLEHMDAISSSPESHLCYQLLSNDSGVWTAEKLAEAAGIPTAKAAQVVKKFLAVKLLRKSGKGYKCPLAGAQVESPQKLASQELFDRLAKRHEELIASGQRTWFRRGIIRADADTLGDFYQLMSVSLSSVTAYTIKEKTPKSALFAVEARAVKLRDF